MIPTNCVALLTIKEGLASGPTWKNGSFTDVPFRINLIASIPSTEVDVILLIKLTGPLNSDGRF